MNFSRVRNLPLAFLIVAGLVSGLYSQSDSISKSSFYSLKSIPIYNPSFELRQRISPLSINTDTIRIEREPDNLMLYGLSAGYLLGGASIHIYQKNAWWKDQRRSFRFENDWEYALWIDKIGHFYGSVILSHTFSGILDAAEVQPPSRVWLASGMALLFQLYVEVEDGFGAQWGFSPGDAAFDVLGACYPVMQYYYPALRDYNFKFSYVPVDLKKVNPNSGQKHIFIDDYAGQKFWLGTSINKFLPDAVGKYVPDWLQLSLGMGVRNLDGSGGGQRDFYLAFDFDSRQLPGTGRVAQFFKNAFSHFHFPAPGVRITNGVAFFGICY